MALLKLTIDGQSELLAALKQVDKNVSDWRPAWAECEKLFYEIEGYQFASQGGRGGQTWQRLSEAYGKWKALKYPGKPILVREGRLKASLTSRTEDSIHEVEKDSLTLGSVLPYALMHQRGGGKLPTRPEIVITPSDKGQFTRRLLTHMQRAGDKAGFKTVGQAGV